MNSLSMDDMKYQAATLSPAKLAHVVCVTAQLQVMRAWYMKVLNAQVSVENEQLCFLRYDEEHHRIGLIRADGLAPMKEQQASVHHYAFTYHNLPELFGTYQRLKDEGIEPFWCINHGPTTSLYYKDPDGNRLELQVDNFSDEECDAFFASGAYVDNPIGIIFDPQEWINRLAAGEPGSSLTVRPPLPAGVSPYEMIRD